MIKGLQVFARMGTVCPCHPALRLSAGFRSAHSARASTQGHQEQESEGYLLFIIKCPSETKFVSFSIVASVRETCADWIRGTEPHDDPVSKGKKDPENGFDIQVLRMKAGMYARTSKYSSY